jgi:hypothetical protein
MSDQSWVSRCGGLTSQNNKLRAKIEDLERALQYISVWAAVMKKPENKKQQGMVLERIEETAMQVLGVKP